jgi:hypothetical protein
LPSLAQIGSKRTGENINPTNNPIKDLSEKIRRYLSGEDVPDKPYSLSTLKGRLLLASDGLTVSKDPDYEAAYKNARNLALELKEKCPGLPKLPPCKSNPITGLQDLLEWCIDTGHSQQQADLASTRQKNEQTISQLIAQGEGHTLEFKETLEYDVDVKVNKNSEDVLLSSLKTIAGFLNSNGGTLLIGVNDSGEIKGIERDLSTMKHSNNDRFEQRIRNCLKDRFSPQPIGKVKISFEKFTEGTICRVDVPANKDIIHLDGDIYVRDGNTTQKPEGPNLTNWIQQRGK